MNKSILYLTFLLLYCTTISMNAEITPHIITFFIRPLPSTYKLSTPKSTPEFKTPGDILNKVINKELNLSSLYNGIYVSYAGFVTRSNMWGQVVFPRKTASQKLSMLVTEDIKAVPVDPIKRKTLLGFVLDEAVPSQYYLYERRHDPETDLTSWRISEQKLATNKKIPYDAIIIFANPNDIIVPLGSVITPGGENLILPDLYVDKDLESALNALRFLKIRHFFAPIQTKYNFKPNGYQERIVH